MSFSRIVIILIGLTVLGLGISKIFFKSDEITSGDTDASATSEQLQQDVNAPVDSNSTENSEINSSTGPSVPQEPPARLQTKDLKAGSTKQVAEGSKVLFNIIVKLMDGKVVFDSYKDGRPWQGTIGDGSLINGIDRGLLGMFQGGKRALWIPPQLAYGTNGIPSQVPPNAKLYAELELISVF